LYEPLEAALQGRDTNVAPITKSQCTPQVGIAALLRYSTDEVSNERTTSAYYDAWPRLSWLGLAPSACLVSISASFMEGRPPQTSNVYCPPAEPGTSLVC
jgi:hypothetical protein